MVGLGAKKEGAAGFFKGIGKGLVGVVARPTGGIVDMASSTFQGIQRWDKHAHECLNINTNTYTVFRDTCTITKNVSANMHYVNHKTHRHLLFDVKKIKYF